MSMRCRLIIEGNSVYEIDEECAYRKKEGQKGGFSGKNGTGKSSPRPEGGNVSALTGK